MKVKKFSGRLFMTVAITVTYCFASLVLLFMPGFTPESKMAVFIALSSIASSISKDYFTRTDRAGNTLDDVEPEGTLDSTKDTNAKTQ